jgi:hypothetical protein
MLCETCQHLLQTHLSSTTESQVSYISHNHQDSLDNLKASASRNCYICDTLWRRFLGAAKSEALSADSPPGSEGFSRCSFPKLREEPTPRVIFYIQKGRHGNTFLLKARLSILFRLIDNSGNSAC